MKVCDGDRTRLHKRLAANEIAKAVPVRATNGNTALNGNSQKKTAIRSYHGGSSKWFNQRLPIISTKLTMFDFIGNAIFMGKNDEY